MPETPQPKAHTVFSKIGIIGGSFDPVHHGHLSIAEATQQHYGLDKIILVPAYCPPHKARPILAPYEHRLAMLQCAIEEHPCFEVSAIEQGGSCPSYAGTTVEAIKKIYGADCSYYFIIGLDVLLTITNWEKSRTYPGLCYFVATTRPGFNRASIEQDIPKEFLPYILIQELPALAISSTDIKYRIRASQSIEGMVPEKVKQYIDTFKIYTRCFT